MGDLVLVTPTNFWFLILTFLTIAEVFGLGVGGFATCALLFLWAIFFSPANNGRKDPLNDMMIICAVILSIGAVCSRFGYGQHILGTYVSLWGAAWALSPRRTFPTGEEVSKNHDLNGKTVMITGPTSGLGQETARVLALRGAHVILVSRSQKKLDHTKNEIEEEIPSAKLSTITCDLGDQESIRTCVKKFEEMKLSLDILINNAGVMALPKRKSTKEGLEFQMGVNHVGHFLLTTLLTPHLEASKPSRVVSLSSIAHVYHDNKFFDNEKLECEPYHKWVAYGNAKFANVLFAKEFNRRYTDKGISAFSLHPGGIFTGLQGDVDGPTLFKWLVIAPFFFKSIAQGCATTLHCALNADPASEGGAYFDNCKTKGGQDRLVKVMATQKEKGVTDEKALKCWEVTEKLICG